jgi:hypothetical protein
MFAVTAVCIAICLAVVASGVRGVRGTTLSMAFRWTLGGLVIWLAAAISEAFIDDDRSGWIDLLNYLTAVMLLCPGIAVLGARRPGAAAWAFFVLVPLVLVLMWPAVASIRTLKIGAPLELEVPAVLGFAVVLIMSSGNYFGTRYTLPTVLFAAVEVLLVAPLSSTVPSIFPSASTARVLAAIVCLMAVLIAAVRASWKIPVQRDWDRVWLDFLDSYGLVWGKRVMDRLNDAARHEKWQLQLDWHGFVPVTGEGIDQDAERTNERLDHMFRWLLKRFVDADWIDRRLEPEPTGEDLSKE